MSKRAPAKKRTAAEPAANGKPVREEAAAAKVAVPAPPFRRLRTYAFDPSLRTQLDTAMLNEAVLKVPWEATLRPGPVGEYLEVVDYDPASHAFYDPVNLNDPHLLAQDGLAPSEGNPQFHQQMVYAVAMTTIGHFERALGRLALWSPHLERAGGKVITRKPDDRYVRRLRIYPHALREANAYYSPDKKALLFGYFPASLSNPGTNLPGGIVFTCLSYDVVAHETTHALLDGLHRYFLYPSNPDVLAFHEAFADLVALFQHFGHPEALRHQIARTRGDLARQNLLGDLARQFGQAIGNRGALRQAIGRVDPKTGQPDAKEIESTFEPHDRGAILVAAAFDAFLAIYKARIADLLRLATGGSGVLPDGEISPDLVNRLAGEASRASGHILHMCIRALDYCPPVDVTFGEYLRAVVTADYDLVPDDDLGYRTAVIEAFRRRGIYPRDVRSLAADSLRWSLPRGFPTLAAELCQLSLDWDLTVDRLVAFRQTHANCRKVHDWLAGQKVPKEIEHELGLALGKDAPHTIERDAKGRPRFEVHSVRPARRVGPDGQLVVDLVIELAQRRRGYLDEGDQQKADAGKDAPEPDFIFRGGSTLLFDLETGRLRHCIKKGIDSADRLWRQREFYRAPDRQALHVTYFGDFRTNPKRGEPFALLHRDYEV